MVYDVVIIGAGVAGLAAAMNLPKSKKVLIINKNHPWECNTFYAQGGVVTAINDEDEISLIQDTMEAGAGLCNEHAVRVLSEHSAQVVGNLIERGFEFDKNKEGELHYTKEAAHSASRILHAGGDATGRYLHHFLLEQNPHPMLEGAQVTDLLIDEGQCYGVCVNYNDEQKHIFSKSVVIASGGLGSLFSFHTNASKISGDLQGICLEKNIELERMEMLQFHPTVYVSSHAAQKQLLTEALRGEGAQLVGENNYAFMKDYDDRMELAPRDIVSRAIFDYKQRTGEEVYLSFNNFEEEYFNNRFPNIAANLRGIGYDLPKDRVPISPAFHYAIGGIKTNLDGEIKGVDNLYAIGEVASTGVHGANRLASNSLLEGLVFASRAAQKIKDKSVTYVPKEFPISTDSLRCEDDKLYKGQLRRIMWDDVGIVRTQRGLKEALNFIEDTLSKPIGRFLKLRLLTAKEIVKSALKRKVSVGVHYMSEDS
ncbi:L-aspartate oxidase [Sulfurimonas sp. MAG313]|nr:L-aspartate oxidase [Sulfurimonas sp. MAG313]MDF1880693.1 L-aspartate oxidase [Sulfurimonas sp. MAG313]